MKERGVRLALESNRPIAQVIGRVRFDGRPDEERTDKQPPAAVVGAADEDIVF